MPPHLVGTPPVYGTRSAMFGFFDSFKRGCGCALGAVTGLFIALVAIGLVLGWFGNCTVNGF